MIAAATCPSCHHVTAEAELIQVNGVLRSLVLTCVHCGLMIEAEHYDDD